jgi:hypothetical protein
VKKISLTLCQSLKKQLKECQDYHNSPIHDSPTTASDKAQNNTLSSLPPASADDAGDSMFSQQESTLSAIKSNKAHKSDYSWAPLEQSLTM